MMFDIPRFYISACYSSVLYVRLYPILISILLYNNKELTERISEVEKIEPKSQQHQTRIDEERRKEKGSRFASITITAIVKVIRILKFPLDKTRELVGKIHVVILIVRLISVLNSLYPSSRLVAMSPLSYHPSD